MNAIEIIQSLPCWQALVSIDPLSGGMTNLNFKVCDQKGAFVVRLGEDSPAHLISRNNEIAAGRAAHEIGVSPRVVHHQPGVLVIEFIEGQVLTEQTLNTPAMLPRVTDLMKRFHQEMPRYFRGLPVLFWVFQVMRHYRNVLVEHDSQYLGELSRLERIADQLEQQVGSVELVFGHNDLLAANFIDDGEKLWLIDFDYAGFNSELFDLANLGSNNQLSHQQEQVLLQRYYGDDIDGSIDGLLWRRYQAMKCASLLRETMWSMVSEVTSEIEFDYSSYTLENRQRFDNAYEDFRNL